MTNARIKIPPQADKFNLSERESGGEWGGGRGGGREGEINLKELSP